MKGKPLSLSTCALMTAAGQNVGGIAAATGQPRLKVVRKLRRLAQIVPHKELQDLGRTVPADELPARVRALLESRGFVCRTDELGELFTRGWQYAASGGA